MNPEERSKKHFEDAAERKHKRELERGVLREFEDAQRGWREGNKYYKLILLSKNEDGSKVHELCYNVEGEVLTVPNEAFVELDNEGAPRDRGVRHFLETAPDRIKLGNIDHQIFT